jgi:hypothetical protein
MTSDSFTLFAAGLTCGAALAAIVTSIALRVASARSTATSWLARQTVESAREAWPASRGRQF